MNYVLYLDTVISTYCTYRRQYVQQQAAGEQESNPEDAAPQRVNEQRQYIDKIRDEVKPIY